MITFSINNNTSTENKILFHSILNLATERNIIVDELRLYDIIKSKKFELQLSNLQNTLSLQSDYHDFKLIIYNISVEDFKKCRAIAKLSASVNSIPNIKKNSVF